MVKTITIRDVVYMQLVKVKRPGESFSMLFERLAETANPMDSLKELRGSVSFKNKKKMLAEIYAKREETR